MLFFGSKVDKSVCTGCGLEAGQWPLVSLFWKVTVVPFFTVILLGEYPEDVILIVTGVGVGLGVGVGAGFGVGVGDGFGLGAGFGVGVGVWDGVGVGVGVCAVLLSLLHAAATKVNERSNKITFDLILIPLINYKTSLPRRRNSNYGYFNVF